MAEGPWDGTHKGWEGDPGSQMGKSWEWRLRRQNWSHKEWEHVWDEGLGDPGLLFESISPKYISTRPSLPSSSQEGGTSDQGSECK